MARASAAAVPRRHGARARPGVPRQAASGAAAVKCVFFQLNLGMISENKAARRISRQSGGDGRGRGAAAGGHGANTWCNNRVRGRRPAVAIGGGGCREHVLWGRN